jgi:hypothetical protein
VQRVRLFACILLLSVSACSSVYYSGLEKIGIPKRDLVQRRVEKTQSAQESTKQRLRWQADIRARQRQAAR